MCVCVCHRWLVLDTDTRDLVSMHTDGNEIISNVKYSPGKTSPVLVSCHVCSSVLSIISAECPANSELSVPADGNFLAVASHDNFVYIYAVTENGRKYSRVGKCTVSNDILVAYNCTTTFLKIFFFTIHHLIESLAV